MENSFYVPINSGSLAHYFSKAIILPAKYFSNKPEDIQNNFNDSILVSENKWVKNSDCTLEVILTDAEIKELNRISDHLFFCNTPIPISRVKSVCFLDPKQKETTIWNINNGAAFIPESIVSVEQNINIEPISDIEIKSGHEFKSVIELSEKIKRFDIILGGFAFMRLGGSSFMNYSPNYFTTLSYFNKLVEEQTNNASKEKGLKFSSKYTGLFSKNESEWSKWQQYVFQNLEPQDIEIIAAKEGEKVEKKFGLLKIDSINPDSHLYELAILATYGDRKNKSTDNLVTDLTNGVIYPDKLEDVSILFGLNNGYSKLRNKYKGSVRNINVKFSLESKLDYYIIESVFQFAFYGTKANYPFDYIDKWCPISKNKDKIKGYETYKILDTIVIAKKKQTPLELFLENYSSEIYLTIARSINQWQPPFVKIDETEAIKFFQKQLQNVLTVSAEALQKKIENECEEYYNSQIQEAVITNQMNIDKLLLEIANLKEENSRLKNSDIISPVTEHSIEPLYNADNSEKEVVPVDIDTVSMVQEPVKEISVNYDLLNLLELKKIAKEKKVKGYTKIENKEELIKLIKSQPTLL